MKFFIKENIASIGRKYPGFRKLIRPFIMVLKWFNESQKRVTCQINGFTYLLNLDDLIQSQMFYFGIFDKKGIDVITSVCRKIKCRTALDIGANVGNHAVFMSPYCGNIYSFEPNDTPGNVFKNALLTKKSNIKLFDVGLSNVSEEIQFYENSNNLGSSSFVKEHMHKREYNEKILKVKIGDEFIQKNNINNIDFIKIDVEGFESKVLSGLIQTIKLNNPIVDFEYNSITKNTFSKENIIEDILNGYTLYGTKRIGLGLIKEGLKIVEFNKNKSYSHVFAIPDRFEKELSSILSN